MGRFTSRQAALDYLKRLKADPEVTREPRSTLIRRTTSMRGVPAEA